MRQFEIYCKWDKKLYAYDNYANVILCMENGIWSVAVWLPEKTQKQQFTQISVYRGNLFLCGRKAEYIVRSGLRDKKTEVIPLPADWRDELGCFYSNLILEADELLLLPRRGSQARILDFHGNVMTKDWQADFAESIEGLKKSCGRVQIRAWGAHIIGGRIFMLLTDKRKDKLAVYNSSERKLELIQVDTCNKMLHLDYAVDGFYVQETSGPDFRIVKLDFSGKILRNVQIKAAKNCLHMQWMDSGKCILAEEDRCFLTDADLRVQEIPLLLDGDMRLKYVNRNLFIDTRGMLYFYDAEKSRFCCFYEKSNVCKDLLSSAEYRKRLICSLKKQSESRVINETDEEIGLKTFLEIVSVKSPKHETQSNIGEAVWNEINR